MTPSSLIEMLISSLNSHTAIRVAVGTPVVITGNDFDEFKQKLLEVGGSKGRPIDKAGVYVIGTDAEVIRIGEGGKSTDNEDSGTMGHRVFQHTKEQWNDEIRVVLFLPIEPGELSRLAEQEALALHFQEEGRLPKHNKDWR